MLAVTWKRRSLDAGRVGAVRAESVYGAEDHQNGLVQQLSIPTVAMTPIAIQEALDGKVVDWMEKVSDGQYDGKERSSYY